MSCLECLEQQRAESMTWKAMTASSWPGSDVFSAWPPWTDWSLLKVLENNAAVLQLEAVVPQGTSWRDFPAFVGRYHIRVSLKLLWATSACCVPRGSLQRRCRCHMPLGCISQKCNWRRLSGLCDRPRLSVVVRDVRCGCYPCLGLDPDSVCSIYRL